MRIRVEMDRMLSSHDVVEISTFDSVDLNDSRKSTSACSLRHTFVGAPERMTVRYNDALLNPNYVRKWYLILLI